MVAVCVNLHGVMWWGYGHHWGALLGADMAVLLEMGSVSD